MSIAKASTLNPVTDNFAGAVARAGALVCRHCGEKYHLDRVVTASDDDVMNDLFKNAFVIGKLSTGSVMVGHSKSATSSDDLRTLESLRSNAQLAWQCQKCHATFQQVVQKRHFCYEFGILFLIIAGVTRARRNELDGD